MLNSITKYKLVLALGLLIAGAGLSKVSAQSTDYLFNFGGFTFTGTFAGQTGYQSGSGLSFTSGGISVLFAGSGVGVDNIGAGTGAPGDVTSMLGSFIYTTNESTDILVISGFNASDTVRLGLVGSVQSLPTIFSGGPLPTTVTLPGAATVTSGFTIIGTFTGATSYSFNIGPLVLGQGGDISAMDITVISVPEPATAALLLIGGGVLAGIFIRSRSTANP